jgi:hypothetical protein
MRASAVGAAEGCAIPEVVPRADPHKHACPPFEGFASVVYGLLRLSGRG